MDILEARRVAHLIGYADHGCSNCVADLVEHANRLFPEFVFTKTGKEENDPTEFDEDDYHPGPSRIVVTVELAALPHTGKTG